MSAQSMDNAGSEPAADTGATPGVSAQPSSDGEHVLTPVMVGESASAIILRRIADVAEQYGWDHSTARLSLWLELQLAELERYRASHHELSAELRARHRENNRTEQRRVERG